MLNKCPCGKNIRKNAKLCSRCNLYYYYYRKKYPDKSYDELVELTKNSLKKFKDKIKRKMEE